MQATALDQDAPYSAHRMVVRRDMTDGRPELVEMRWGLKPKEPGGPSHRFIRSEDKVFPDHRCLIPASEFIMTQGKHRFRAALEDGNFFYLAGIWRPENAWWPASCAILTVEANPEVARYQERQGAVIRRNRHMHWLDFTLPESELLLPLAPNSFVIEELTGSSGSQTLLPI